MESRTLGILKRLLAPLAGLGVLYLASDIGARLLWNFGPAGLGGPYGDAFRSGDLSLCQNPDGSNYSSITFFNGQTVQYAPPKCSQFQYHGWWNYRPHTLTGNVFLHIAGLLLAIMAVIGAFVVCIVLTHLIFLFCSWVHYVATGKSLGTELANWWRDSSVRASLSERSPRSFRQLTFVDDEGIEDDEDVLAGDPQVPVPVAEWQTGPGLGAPPPRLYIS